MGVQYHGLVIERRCNIADEQFDRSTEASGQESGLIDGRLPTLSRGINDRQDVTDSIHAIPHRQTRIGG
jgi:hypothetical protein